MAVNDGVWVVRRVTIHNIVGRGFAQDRNRDTRPNECLYCAGMSANPLAWQFQYVMYIIAPTRSSIASSTGQLEAAEKAVNVAVSKRCLSEKLTRAAYFYCISWSRSSATVENERPFH